MNNTTNNEMKKIYQILKLFGRVEMFGTKIVFNNIKIVDNVIDNDEVISLDVEGERYDVNTNNDVGLLEAATFIVGKAAHHNRIMGGNK